MKVYTKALYALLLSTVCAYGSNEMKLISERIDERKKKRKMLIELINTDENIKQVKKFLKENAGLVKLSCCNGATPLFCAAKKGDRKIVELLLRHGADINESAYGCGGFPGLYFLLNNYNNVEMVKLFLKGGAKLNWTFDNCDEDRTLLHMVARKGEVELTKLLLLFGANKFLENKESQTASELAKKKGHKEIATLIDEFPDKVDIFSLKQKIINVIRENDNIKVPSNYPKPLLQVNSDSAFNNWNS